MITEGAIRASAQVALLGALRLPVIGVAIQVGEGIDMRVFASADLDKDLIDGLDAALGEILSDFPGSRGELRIDVVSGELLPDAGIWAYLHEGYRVRPADSPMS